MPNKLVEDMIVRLIELEKKVAVLMSWHKVQVGLLAALLLVSVTILVRK